MIIYLHGFNSIGVKSGKYVDLVKGLPDINVYAPSYPSNDPDKAIAILSQFIEERLMAGDEPSDEIMLVGTSLGGYYAQYLGHKYGTKVVLINPALTPAAIIKNHLGENTNYYTGEKYTVSLNTLEALERYDVDSYKHEHGTLVLLDAGDEIIKYSSAAMRYADVANVIVYPGGCHRFDHMEEALPEIAGYYHSIWA